MSLKWLNRDQLVQYVHGGCDVVRTLNVKEMRSFILSQCSKFQNVAYMTRFRVLMTASTCDSERLLETVNSKF